MTIPSAWRQEGHLGLVLDVAELRDVLGGVAQALEQGVDLARRGPCRILSLSRASMKSRWLFFSSFCGVDRAAASRSPPVLTSFSADVEQSWSCCHWTYLVWKSLLACGQVGAVEFDEGVAFLDLLAERGVDLLDPGVEPGADLGQGVGVVGGSAGQLELDRLGLGVDRRSCGGRWPRAPACSS